MNSHGITTTALDLINHGGGAFGRGFALTMNGAANVVDNDGCSTPTKFKRVLLHNCQKINSSMFFYWTTTNLAESISGAGDKCDALVEVEWASNQSYCLMLDWQRTIFIIVLSVKEKTPDKCVHSSRLLMYIRTNVLCKSNGCHDVSLFSLAKMGKCGSFSFQTVHYLDLRTST